MPGANITLKVHSPDVVLPSPAWFPVDGTLVQPGVLARGAVDGVDVDDWDGFIQDLGSGLHQTASFLVQARPLQEQSVYVDALRWGVVDILLGRPNTGYKIFLMAHCRWGHPCRELRGRL